MSAIGRNYNPDSVIKDRNALRHTTNRIAATKGVNKTVVI